MNEEFAIPQVWYKHIPLWRLTLTRDPMISERILVPVRLLRQGDYVNCVPIPTFTERNFKLLVCGHVI